MLKSYSPGMPNSIVVMFHHLDGTISDYMLGNILICIDPTCAAIEYINRHQLMHTALQNIDDKINIIIVHNSLCLATDMDHNNIKILVANQAVANIEILKLGAQAQILAPVSMQFYRGADHSDPYWSVLAPVRTAVLAHGPAASLAPGLAAQQTDPLTPDKIYRFMV